ncbi:hypothetical protein [Aureispira anguillae]|uniref:Lipoprotein n=1 Tax=Aureispira anguillae TaxID=2864201 RepID=A0A916DQ72_9BACT|nr:hypothetical protein [Aureispira anguillae]BDS09925.1 hypothetical protein AsAng_0006300 [Aureispira anguillae]
MRLKKHVFKAPIFILIFLIFYSCTITKNQRTKDQDSEGILLYGEAVQKNDSYANIKGTVPRFRAMMCGKFAQYLPDTTAEGGYSVWLVNDGRDSVVFYQLPVGNHHKVGYWVYQSQVLTSLPDNPVSQGFIKLEGLNRDTIKAIIHKAPDGFMPTTKETLNITQDVFKEIEWAKLEKAEGTNIIYYVRKSPLEYLGTSALFHAPSILEGKGFLSIYYRVSPQKIAMGRKGYNENKEYLGSAKEEYLLKQAMIDPNWLN